MVSKSAIHLMTINVSGLMRPYNALNFITLPLHVLGISEIMLKVCKTIMTETLLRVCKNEG